MTISESIMEEILKKQILKRHKLLKDLIGRSRDYIDKYEEIGVREEDIVNIKLEIKLQLENFSKALVFYIDRASDSNIKLIEECTEDQFELEKLQFQIESIAQWVKPSASSSNSKLPTLELLKFDGDILNFSEFFERFHNTVHEKPMKNSEKLAYLLNSLEGNALETLRGLNTERDYDSALDLLKRRYGSKSLLVDAHYQAFDKIVKSSDSIKECRQTLNTIEKHLRILESLGENVENNHFRVSIGNKFPDRIIYQLNLSTPTDRTVTMLREGLDKVITALERVDNCNEAGPLPVTSSTEALFIGVQNKRPRTRNQENQRNTKKPKNECAFCSKSHYSDKCTVYNSVEERRARMKDHCYKCLNKGHFLKDCKRILNCYFCESSKHHGALCPLKINKTTKQEWTRDKNKYQETRTIAGNELIQLDISIPDNNDINIFTNSNHINSFLQTAIAQIKNYNNNKDIKCRILLDSGSQRSYITSKTACKLDLKPDKEDQLIIYTFGSNNPKITISPSAKIEIVTKRGICKNIRVNIVPHITNGVPVCDLKNEAIDVSADDYSLGNIIDVLIGNDYYFSFFKKENIKIGKNLYLLNTDFGWVITGNNESNKEDNILSAVTYCQCHESICPYFVEPDLPLRNIDMKYLWALESIGILDSPKTSKEEEAVKFFNDTVKYNAGRYQVKWPFIQFPPDLPTNYNLAYGRLKSLLKREKEETLKEYNDILQEQLEANIIEIVEDQEITPYKTKTPVHYLPHHIVKQEGKRGRIVYDASSKVKDQKSLNECLYRGPSMIEDLNGLLLNFRTNKIGIIADVEKAFLQVGLQKEDRDVTRFLWLKDINAGLSETNLLHLRFCRVPFGIISSPFLLTATIRNHITQRNKDLIEKVADKCYMDNLVTGMPNLKEAVKLFEDTQNTFKELSMNIRDWMSNSQELMKIIPPHLKMKQTDKCKVLGLTWNVKEDFLELKLNEEIFQKHTNPMLTKRDVLKTLARIFDPYGLAAPLLLPLKIFFQELCIQKIKWDKILSEELHLRWDNIIKKLEAAKKIQIPRYIKTKNSDSQAKYELHTFTDASKDAYAAVVYLRVISEDKITTTFIMSKARITPIQDKENLKIPRLELLAYLIGCRLIKYVKDNLNLPIDRQYMWTDSYIVLSWLKTSKLLPPFVSRRIAEIKQLNNIEFCYISSKENPADLATRPELWEKKKLLWFTGPTFLTSKMEHWPTDRNISEQQVSLFVGETLDVIDGPEMSTKGYETDMPDNLTGDEEIDCQEEKPIDELVRNIKKIQREYFASEVLGKRTSLAKNLDLFMDVEGVLRCKGRMRNTDWNYDSKYPILIPKECNFTNKIILDVHEKNYHVGPSHTLSLIRQKYWIPQGRVQVKKILRKCSQCTKHGGGPYTLPAPPALPAERVNYSSPFTFVGLDYFGPIYVDSDRGKSKRWVCLYTCLAIRAIHLEIVHDLTAEECLLALRRFTANRGVPKKIISDNALYFKLTSEVLNTPYCYDNQIKWRNIPQLAPWHGGFYERLVGLVKNCLKRTLDKHLLRDSQLETIMKEVETVINSRPLTSVGSDLEYVLKPNDFLSLGKCLEINPAVDTTSIGGTNTKVDLVQGWKRGQIVLNEFKKMFQNQYLPSLREKHRYTIKQPKIKSSKIPHIGDIVQIKEDLKNRILWKVGKITSLIKDADGQCRVARVKVGSTELTRSIGHLYPLEMENPLDNIEQELQSTSEKLQNATETEDKDIQLEVSNEAVLEETRHEISTSPMTNKSPNSSLDLRTSEKDIDLDAERNQNLEEEEEHYLEEEGREMEEKRVSEDTPNVDNALTDSRPVRIAALRAKEKICEWTKQLVMLLQTSSSFGSVAEFTELHE